jgi:hypothetical protein
MKSPLAQLKNLIPASSLGKSVTSLICLLFLILPFQTPIFHKAFKKLSLSILPASLPGYFPSKIAFFPSEFLLLILLFLLIRKQGLSSFWTGPSKYLTLLFGTALISLATSSSSTYLLMYTRFIEATLVIVLFNAIRSAFDKDTIIPFIRLLAWIIFFLSLLECSVALLQFFSQGSIGLKCIGECDIQSYAYPMSNAHKWIFDTQKTRDFLIRASGTFPHPNIFGGFLFCALLNTFYLYFTHHKKKLLLFGILIQIPTLILSFSRAALIAFAFTAILWFFLQARNREKRKEVLQLCLTLIGLAVFCLCLFYPQLSARGGIINYNNLVKGADTERMIYQKIALDMVKEHPVLGIGLNNFQLESHRFFPEGREFPSRVHNIYLLLAAETGLIGVGCFLLFLVSLIRHARRAILSQEGVFLLMLFSGFLFIGACDFYVFCTPHGQILFFGDAAFLSVISWDRNRNIVK